MVFGPGAPIILYVGYAKCTAMDKAHLVLNTVSHSCIIFLYTYACADAYRLWNITNNR